MLNPENRHKKTTIESVATGRKCYEQTNPMLDKTDQWLRQWSEANILLIFETMHLQTSGLTKVLFVAKGVATGQETKYFH